MNIKQKISRNPIFEKSKNIFSNANADKNDKNYGNFLEFQSAASFIVASHKDDSMQGVDLVTFVEEFISQMGLGELKFDDDSKIIFHKILLFLFWQYP